MPVRQLGAIRVYEADSTGPPIGAEADALDLMGELYGQEIDLLAIPVERLAPAFFSLRTGIAGAVLQKFTNYRLQVAIIGDIGPHVESSTALRDFVRESNRRRDVLFVRDLAELEARLAP